MRDVCSSDFDFVEFSESFGLFFRRILDCCLLFFVFVDKEALIFERSIDGGNERIKNQKYGTKKGQRQVNTFSVVILVFSSSSSSSSSSSLSCSS